MNRIRGFGEGHYQFCFTADGHQKYEFLGVISIHKTIESAKATALDQQNKQYDTVHFFIGKGNIFDAINVHHYLNNIFVMKNPDKIYLTKMGVGKVRHEHPSFGHD